MKNKGFTLAEVLITLTIIGVIAAATIPNLMTSTQGKEYQAGAQKAFATLSNALTMRTALSGEDFEDFVRSQPNLMGSAPDLALLAYLVCQPGSTITLGNGIVNQDDLGSNFTSTNLTCQNGEGSAALMVIEQLDESTIKLKDGGVMQFNATVSGNAGSYVLNKAWAVVDTNGSRGPSRTIGFGGNDATGCTGFTLDSQKTDRADARLNDTPATNKCPDMVVFRITPEGELTPFDQRTRNILATGNAMVSQ